MADSVVSIVNLALDLLGAEPILSLEDNTKQARLASRAWPAARDYVLRSYPWHCARRRARIAASATAPTHTYTSQFPLPAGPSPEYCLRVLTIDDEPIANYDGVIEGRALLSYDAGPLDIGYIARISDPLQHDAMLDEALSFYLAWRLTISLENAASRRDELWRLFERIVAEARAVDASESPSAEFVADDWLNARY
jgi:hypothetical protein